MQTAWQTLTRSMGTSSWKHLLSFNTTPLEMQALGEFVNSFASCNSLQGIALFGPELVISGNKGKPFQKENPLLLPFLPHFHLVLLYLNNLKRI